MDSPASQQRRRPWSHTHLPYGILLVVPVLLAVATGVALFLRTDVNVALLYSQCSSHARLPGLTRVPFVGTPLCYLVSFFEYAIAPWRALISMAAILAFVTGLLTVSTVEAARLCNKPNVLIAYPTGPWLVFNLIGGALVWELAILPAFFRRAKQIHAARRAHSERLERHRAAHASAPAGDRQGDDASSASSSDDSLHVEAGSANEAEALSIVTNSRHLTAVAEVYAIPAAVALGCVVPSVLMLVLRTPAAIGAWLFFPAYVSIVRQLVRFIVRTFLFFSDDTHHLEAHRRSLIYVYGLPIVVSLAAHVALLWHLFARKDDRQELTRSTVAFVETDAFFIALTVLYWLLAETGWRVALTMLAWSILLGPGAGVCIAWIFREPVLAAEPGETGSSSREADPEAATERSPLLGPTS